MDDYFKEKKIIFYENPFIDPEVKMDSKKGKDEQQRVKSHKNSDLAGKIEDTDEMKLKMLAGLENSDPEDLLYPPELNAHLIEQLKVMTCENNELRKLLFTRDEELKEQNKTVKELNTRIRDLVSGPGPTISSKSAGIISAKITDLCKKNRHLVAEVENYKTKVAAYERKIMAMEMSQENEKLDVCYCQSENVDLANPEEIKDLNNKLAVVNKKLTESKSRNLELKNEILIATKVLQKELGDKFTSIKELQNDIAGWKGRAQQIFLLQAKVSQLEEKLNLKPKEIEKRGDQVAIIRDIEAKKKKDVADLQKEVETLQEELSKTKKKLDAAKCRVRNVECDSLVMRQKMQTFMEKSNHDDELINEQRNTIKKLELYYQELLQENTMKMNKMHNEIAEYQKLNSNTDTKIEAMRKQSAEKAAKIEELRAQLSRYEECSLQSVFFTPMRTATENEIQKLGQLVVKLNERLDEERQNWKELDMNNRKLKAKKKQLEKKLATLEEEIKAIESKRAFRLSRYSAVSKTDQNFDATSLSTTKKKSSSTVVPSANGMGDSSQSSKEVETDELDKEDLKYQLELTEERLKIMEDKLRMVEEEKLEDCNNFTSMIQTSKQLFSDALQVLQKEKCICTPGQS